MLPWCELPVEVDTLLDERRVDADQVQNGRGQSVLLCDVSEQQKYVVCKSLPIRNCQDEVNPIEIFVPLDYCVCHSSSSTQVPSGKDTAISFKAKVASHNF